MIVKDFLKIIETILTENTEIIINNKGLSKLGGILFYPNSNPLGQNL